MLKQLLLKLLNPNIGLKNNVLYKVYDADGFLIKQVRYKNTDVANGRALCAARAGDIDSVNNTPINFVGVTPDNTAVNDADTGLGLVTIDAATAISKTRITTSTTNDTLRCIFVVNTAVQRTYAKAGLFFTSANMQTVGLVCAQVLGATVTVPAGGALSITWDVQFA